MDTGGASAEAEGVPEERRLRRGKQSRKQLKKRSVTMDNDDGVEDDRSRDSGFMDNYSIHSNDNGDSRSIDSGVVVQDEQSPDIVQGDVKSDLSLDNLSITNKGDISASGISNVRTKRDVTPISDDTNISDTSSVNSEDGINDSITNFSLMGSSLYGFIGNVSTKAWSLFSNTAQATWEYISKWNDQPEEWHECDSEEEAGEEDFSDATEVLVKDKLYYICNELMTTEEQYVRKLDILLKVKHKTTKILKPDVVQGIFQNIEVIHQFHSDALLPELQERIRNWQKFKKVGDIMKKLAPFLKLYTEYVKNFEKATSLVDTWEQKSNTFAALLKEIKIGAEYGRLRVQAHMLEPVQRVPRYELLLRDYLKRLPEDSPDRTDAEKAMQLVAEAASHFENMMKRDTKKLELMQLQNQLDGPVNIVTAKRELLKKGKVYKLNARGSNKQERIIFLFNDCLLLCAEQVLPVPGMSTRYKVKNMFDLEHTQISEGNNLDVPHTFYVSSTDKVVELCTNTADEMSTWQDAIDRQITSCTKMKLLRRGSNRLNDGKNRKSLGDRAPVFIRHSDVSMCMVCAANFTALKRKHNCRACGNVICAKCSSHNAALEYDKSGPLKVCDECLILLEGDENRKSSKKTFVEGTPLQRGYLQLSSDSGKTWKKRWFAFHDNSMLYSFKALQDISPLTSLSIKSFSCAITTISQKSTKVLELIGVSDGKKYFLADDSEDTIDKWFQILGKYTSIIEDATCDSDDGTEETDNITTGKDDNKDEATSA